MEIEGQRARWEPGREGIPIVERANGDSVVAEEVGKSVFDEFRCTGCGIIPLAPVGPSVAVARGMAVGAGLYNSARVSVGSTRRCVVDVG